MATKRDGIYKRGPVWWIRTDPVDGKPRSTGCRDREAARRYRAKRERLAADPTYAAAEEARLADWIGRVIAGKERDGSSEATVEVYRQKLGHFLRIAPNALLSEVEPGFVDAFVAQRRTEDVTDHTISKEVTHLCTVLKAAKRAGCYAGDIATLRPPDLHAGYKPRKRALTREEVMRLLGELKPELGALVAICVSIGCRLSEAYRLLPSDIDWAKNSVFIDGRKTKESSRYVPILSLFTSLFASGARALPLGKEPNNLRRDLSAACARSGIANATPNDLRRTHATLLAEAGVDRDVTRRLLGHTTTRLVDTVYGRPSTEALGALAEAKLLTAAPVKTNSSGPSGAGAGNDPGPAARGGIGVSGHISVDSGARSGEPVNPDRSDEVETLHGRDSAPGIEASNDEKHRADFEIRTRDLRFTKPVSGEPLSRAKRRFPLLSRGELLRSGASDDRRRQAAATSTLQLGGG